MLKRVTLGKVIANYFTKTLDELNPLHNLKGTMTNIRADILAGITVAIIALPLALAFGVGSGLGPMAGLWGAICGGLIGSLLGGSKIGVSGPTGPKMAQLALIMLGYKLADGSPDAAYAFTIIFLSGLILVFISTIRIARIVYYIPYTVIAGFMCGIGLIVMILELNPLLGIPVESSVRAALLNIPHSLQNVNKDALAVALPTLIVLFTWPKLQAISPKAKALPGPLVGLIVGTAIADLLPLNVIFIEHIPMGFPDITLPDFSHYAWQDYFWPACSLAGLAVFDSLLTCLVNDKVSGDKHSSDRETFGQGMANMAAGLVGGLTTATATMRSLALYESGGRTVLASFIHGAVLLLIAVALGPWAEKIPMACLAAILFKVGIDIIDYRILKSFFKIPASDKLVFVSVWVLTIWEDLLIAVAVGMGLACLRFVIDLSKAYVPKVISSEFNHATKELYSGKRGITIKISGPFFFGTIKLFNETVQQTLYLHEVVVFDLSEMTFLDLSGVYLLDELQRDLLAQGINVYFVGAPAALSDKLANFGIIPSPARTPSLHPNRPHG